MNRLPKLTLCVVFALFLGVILVLTGAQPAAAAAPQQSSQPIAVSKYEPVNVRSGPSTNYPVVGTLAYGEQCAIMGRDTATGWWLINCATGVTGWVSYDVVNVIGDPSSVPLYSVGGSAIVAPPEPVSPQQPVSYSGWKASYYANKDLNGVPVLVQDVPEINFDWGAGSPGPTVPPNYFSARYERTFNLAPGNYLLTLRYDDGARVFVDDRLIMDDWRVGSVRELSSVVALSAAPRFRVEYFEDTGNALISFTITPFNNGVPPIATPPPYQPSVPDLAIPQDQWRARYFNNTDLGGNPVAAQYVPRGFYPLDQNWGTGSPAPGVGADYWSATFEGTFYFTPANYEFFAQSDDGVRVYIDNILVINAWYDGYVNASNKFDNIGSGYHTMRIDYFDRTGGAYVRVWWAYAGTQQPVPAVPPPPIPY